MDRVRAHSSGPVVASVDRTTAIGLAAGLLTTLSLVPQLVKIWRTRSASDISGKMFSAFSVGVALWLAYGILQREMPMILWNSVSLALAAAILAMKLKFGGAKAPRP
jgi:MtN3 and saliva related transmembrane protein